MITVSSSVMLDTGCPTPGGWLPGAGMSGVATSAIEIPQAPVYRAGIELIRYEYQGCADRFGARRLAETEPSSWEHPLPMNPSGALMAHGEDPRGTR